MLKINDIVTCPFQSIGVIREILNMPGHGYYQDIISRKGYILHPDSMRALTDDET